ncbi:MAG TPA: 30S ribosomal protein S16 [Gammaproteobacteria bacterium]|jgi:small subunit ribosomal protein S16|nr:30S ribosomal protein S16 [Gammaproteobacteria bacterium]
MVTIRLARHGSKKHPFYHINVADRAAGRNGRFVERVGFYNPVARGGEEELRLDLDRVQYWIGVGAQPTDKVRSLVARARRAAGAAAA